MPRSSFDDLVFRLRADAGQLQRELREIEGRTNRTARRMETSFGRASRGVGRFTTSIRGAIPPIGLLAAGAAAASAAFVAATKDALDFADSIDKGSAKVGLSAETFQEYVYAAQQVSIEQNTLTMAVQRFTRRAGEAANGTGEAKDAIAQLGITLRDTNGRIRDTDTLFTEALAALAAIQDPAERLRLAFKLFDSEGAVLVNLAENFGRLRQEARDLGVVIDEQTIRKSVDLRDEFGKLSQEIKTDLRRALLDLGPVLTGLVGQFEKMAKGARFFAELVTTDDRERLEDISGELREIDAEIRAIQQRKPDTARSIFAELFGGDSTEDEIEALRKRRQALISERDELRRRLTHPATPPPPPGSTPPPGPGGAPDPKATVEEIQNQVAATDEVVSVAMGSIQNLEFVTAESLQKTAEGLNALKDATQESHAQFEQLFGFMSAGFAASIAEMVTTGNTGFRELGLAFAREFIQRAVEAALRAGFLRLLSLGTASFGGGEIAKTNAVASSNLAAIRDTPFVGGRATGGFVGAKHAALVGEDGPELFIPNTAGTIVPSAGSGRAMAYAGGGGVEVIINNYGNDRVERQPDSTGQFGRRQIRLMIGQAVADDARSGGPASAALARTFGLKRIGERGV